MGKSLIVIALLLSIISVIFIALNGPTRFLQDPREVAHADGQIDSSQVEAVQPEQSTTVSEQQGADQPEIIILGLHPEVPLYEQELLFNHLNFDLDFKNLSGRVLHFQRGLARYFDERDSLLSDEIIAPNTFAANVQIIDLDSNQEMGATTEIPARARVVFYFPFTKFPRKESPVGIEVSLYFEGLKEPVIFSDIRPLLHEQNRHNYIFPFDQPNEGSWFTTNSHELRTKHRRTNFVLTRTDGFKAPERYAYDWVVQADGANFRGDAARNESYFAYGELVRAISDGIVVKVRDGIAENERVGEMNTQQSYGNVIVIDHGNGEFSLYAHMQPGLSVQLGQQVRRGDVIGKVGNSGFSSEPHMHFQLNNSAEFYNDIMDIPLNDSLPIYFKNVSFVDAWQLRSSWPTATQLTIESKEEAGRFPEAQPIAVPTKIEDSIDLTEVTRFAVGGDRIEAMFEFEMSTPRALQIQLQSLNGADLDIFLLNSDLFISNPEGKGSGSAGYELFEVNLEAGRYFIFISRFDDGVMTDLLPFILTLE